ncbi:MAG: hypothetical protein WED08_03210 [Patescibacteria group bacterium]
MRIRLRSILYGVLLYLAFEAWVTFLSILEVANENLFLFIQGTIAPAIVVASALALAGLAVTAPWDEVL